MGPQSGYGPPPPSGFGPPMQQQQHQQHGQGPPAGVYASQSMGGMQGGGPQPSSNGMAATYPQQQQPQRQGSGRGSTPPPPMNMSHMGGPPRAPPGHYTPQKLSNQGTGPPSPNMIAGMYKQPMVNFSDPNQNQRPSVRFDDAPASQIGMRTSFQELPSIQISLYSSQDRMFPDKQLASSLYASADGLLESRQSHINNNPSGLVPGGVGSFDATFPSSFSGNGVGPVRSLMRSEADKIAERLLKTEEELERLRKQGQLIGESLRKQKMLEESAQWRTPSATSDNSMTSSSSYTVHKAQLGTFGSASSASPGNQLVFYVPGLVSACSL